MAFPRGRPGGGGFRQGAEAGRAGEIIRSLSRFSSQRIGSPSSVDSARRPSQKSCTSAPAITRARESRSTFRRSRFVPCTRNFAELEQVTLNFVLNAQQAIEAAHYGNGQGRIEIRLSDAGDKVRLEVHDNGPGVGPDDEPKLFQPFFTTKPVGQGTGLGLSVSLRHHPFVRRIDWLFPRNASGGASFFFELPALEVSNDVVAFPPRRPAGAAGALIHDEPAVLRRPRTTREFNASVVRVEPRGDGQARLARSDRVLLPDHRRTAVRHGHGSDRLVSST